MKESGTMEQNYVKLKRKSKIKERIVQEVIKVSQINSLLKNNL